MREKQPNAVDQMNAADRDMLLKLLQERERRKAGSNEIFKPVREFMGRYVILIGGSGSGKSYDIADYLSQRFISEQAIRLLTTRKQYKDLVESVFPLMKNRLNRNYSEFRYTVKNSRGNEKITLVESEIIFSGLDDAEKLKSIFDISSIFVEEADQVNESDLNELDRRLRGYKGKMQIYMCFNPVSQLSYLKKKFFDELSRDHTQLLNALDTGRTVKKETFDNKETLPKKLKKNEKIVFDVKDNKYKIFVGGEDVENRIVRTLAMRGKIEFNNFPYYKDVEVNKKMLNEEIIVYSEELSCYVREYKLNTLIIHSTYHDNKFIDANYYQVMEKMKTDAIDDYFVYALGQWGIMGQIYFDKGKVNNRITNSKPQLRTGAFEYDSIGKTLENGDYSIFELIDSSIKIDDNESGELRIYEEPVENGFYVMGCDTAGEGSDYNVAYVINNVTGDDVAVLRSQRDEDEFARQVYCLGKYYGTLNECGNNCLVAIEINFSTHVLKELQRLGYDHLYVRETSPDKISGDLVNRYGFSTNQKTRPLMLSQLRTIVRESSNRLKDLNLLMEMTTFVKNEKGKPVAASGQHDDVIMARAITEFVRHSQRDYSVSKDDFSIKKLPEDCKEDYKNANRDGKDYLRKKWTIEGLFRRGKVG